MAAFSNLELYPTYTERTRPYSIIVRSDTHGDLERLLQVYKLAYNGRLPDEAVGQRLKEKPELANQAYQPPEARDLANIKAAAQLAVLSAKEVSHPDS